MFACLPHLFNKLFAFIAKCETRRRQAQYAAREFRRHQALYVRPRLEGLEERAVPALVTFTGPAGGAWDVAANWDLGFVPGSTDTADIPSGKSCTLSTTMAQSVSGLTVEGSLTLGSTLNVGNGTAASGSTFDMATGSELAVTSSMDFGGSGTLSGKIDAQGASVTFDAFSAMTLASGVQLIGSGAYFVYGPVTVSAALTQSSTMVLDNNGGTTKGALTGAGSLSGGGEFDWDGGTIGLSGGTTFIAAADLKIQGANTKTLSAGTLTNQCNGADIGGTGGLTILPGATFDNLGNPATTVTIPMISTMGSGTFLNDADAFFDANGDTVLSGNFTNLGTLVVGSGSSLTLSAGPGSVVDLDGTLQLNSDLTLLGAVTSSRGFIEDAGAGTLKIGNGGTAGTLTVASGQEALLDGFVEVTSTGTLDGAGEVYNNGKLTLDIGATTSIGSYQQTSAGTLHLKASGPGLSSKLTVLGATQLSGTLDLEFVGGYTPTSGTAFPVLTASSVGAHFDTTPANMTVTYGTTGVTATEN